MKLPNKKYKIIYADPPWKYQGEMIKGMYVTRHYPVLSLKELNNIPSSYDKINRSLLEWI